MSATQFERAETPPFAIHRYLNWTSIIGGAILASAISLILIGFGAAIGLSAASTSPSWRDASFALWLLSGLFLILISIASFGVGGYFVGRTGGFLADASDDETRFRDGAQGLVAWGLSVLLTAFLAVAAAGLSRPAVSQQPSIASNAESLLGYELDRLFRTDRATTPAEMEATRAAAGRILLTVGSHDGVAAEDRAYLIRMVAARTEVGATEAERRVALAIDRSRDAISRARRSAVITAFMTAAALLIGAAIAWLAAHEGALDRRGRAGSRMGMLFHNSSFRGRTG
jgi:hypothetical protein